MGAGESKAKSKSGTSVYSAEVNKPAPKSEEKVQSEDTESETAESDILTAENAENAATQEAEDALKAARKKQYQSPKVTNNANSAKVREGQNTSLMILPRFTVIDKSKAEPIMAEFVKKTRNEAGCLYYGWSLCGDQLVCEEIYLNAAAVAAHLQNIGPQIGQITAEGVAKLDSIALHGPAGEVEKCKKLFDPLGAKYFITDSSVTNMRGYASKIASRPLDIVLIRPYFTVLDWDKARPIMAEFVRRTGTEGRMVFYGWDIDGDTLYCREGYRDGDAVNAHLKNVGSCLGELLAEGVAKLNSIAIHGPAAELEKVKPGTEEFGTKYYAIHSGFQQYA